MAISAVAWKVEIFLNCQQWYLIDDYHVSVSHTTDDLIFEWYPPESIPLVVEPIQLPQLELIHNTTEDCTTSYSTGKCLLSESESHIFGHFTVPLLLKLETQF